MDEDREKVSGYPGRESDWDQWYEDLVYSVARQIELEREKLKSDPLEPEPATPQP